MTAPHVHVIQARSPSPAAAELAAVLMLLEEGLECVEERHAAVVEHALLDDLVRPQQQRLRDRQSAAEKVGAQKELLKDFITHCRSCSEFWPY